MALPDNAFQQKQLQGVGPGQQTMDPLQAMLAELEPPFSQEQTVRITEGQEEERFDIGLQLDYVTRQAMGAMYGDAFPLLKEQPGEEDWVRWGESLWDRHASQVTHRLHIVERNRLFRMGVQ